MKRGKSISNFHSEEWEKTDLTPSSHGEICSRPERENTHLLQLSFPKDTRAYSNIFIGTHI